MNVAKRPRQPKLWWPPHRLSKRQQIHALLRNDPTLTIEQLVKLTGAPWGLARTSRATFFA